MTSRSTRTRWLASAPGVLLVLSAGLASCVTRPVDSLPPEQSGQLSKTFPARPNDKVDVLFVIDNSGSMANKQANLGTNFKNFVAALRDASGAPYDYRIAVASTDVGVGGVQVDPSQFQLCNNPNKPSPVDQDKGVLQTTIHSDKVDWDQSNAGIFACGDPTQGIPTGDQALCDQLTAQRMWLTTNCNGKALTADKPYLENNKTLNTSDDDVGNAFRCIGSLGVNGCFIEQQLEGGRAALDNNRAVFIRPEAYLAVVILSDETECSLQNFGLVDPNATGFKSQTDVGFRCYLDAYNCSGDSTFTGTGQQGENVTFTRYTACAENDQWLVPFSTYLDFFTNNIKGMGATDKIIIAGITGDPDYTNAPSIANGGPGAQAANIVFVWESHDAGLAGTVDYQSASCGSTVGSGCPNLRVKQLLDAFPDPMTGKGTFVSICQDNYGPALQQLGQRISNKLATICIDVPTASISGGKDPNSVCLLEEQGPNGEVRQSNIADVSKTGAPQWSITPNSPNCPATGSTDPTQTLVEITIDPTFRGTFQVDSTIAVTCAQ
jgi:hypothetical protein